MSFAAGGARFGSQLPGRPPSSAPAIRQEICPQAYGDPEDPLGYAPTDMAVCPGKNVTRGVCIHMLIEGGMMAKMLLTVIIREEEGVFVSRCPELEIASCGDSPQDALDNIREAIELYLENARALDMLQELKPVLTSRHTFTSLIEVDA